MATEERFQITPHRDIERSISRKPLEYFLTFPDQPSGDAPGLILSIPGYGDRADSAYQRDKLRPYLADRYGCLVCGVNYFGIDRECPPGEIQLRPGKHFLHGLSAVHRIPWETCVVNGRLDFARLVDKLKQKGIRRACAYCRIIASGRSGDYESFGFLPALDHLAVLADILKRHAVSRRKLIALGSSYGGYVALLLGKFAPDTFSVIIDNSGFVKPLIADLAGSDLAFQERAHVTFNGVEFPVLKDSPWTILDEESPDYFSDSHRKIRSLLVNGHGHRSSSRYYVFHSVKDALVPIDEKEACVKGLRGQSSFVQFKKVTEADLDSSLFRNLDHGMSASLRTLFDRVASMDGLALEKEQPATDFEMNSRRVFPCGSMQYIIQYKQDLQLEATLSPTR